MIENIKEILRYFFPFMAFFALITLIIYIAFLIILKKYNPSKKKIYIYGVLFDLNKKDIFAIVLAFMRYLFIGYCLYKSGNMYYSLVFIAVLTIILNIVNFHFINTIFDICLTSLNYFIILSKDVFFDYINIAGFLYYVIIIYMLLQAFGICLATYDLLKNLALILSNNRYVKNKKDKINTKKEKRVKVKIAELKENN